MRDSMNRKNPCCTCGGGGDCDECLNSPKNSTPIKLYTPKGAARAMLAGKTLKGKFGDDCFWGTNEYGETGFFRRTEEGRLIIVFNFSGLWEEL